MDQSIYSCTIKDNTGGTLFIMEVQPKPTSPGHDYGHFFPLLIVMLIFGYTTAMLHSHAKPSSHLVVTAGVGLIFMVP